MIAYRYRLYPSPEQAAQLEQHFGNARYIYNRGINKWKELYDRGEKCSWMTLGYGLVDLKKEFPWLGLSQSNSLYQSLKNLGDGYKKFFKKKGDYPQYKNKYSKQSVSFRQNTYVKTNSIKIPKIGYITASIHRECLGKIKSATITKTATGKYYVSITTDYELGKPTTSGQVGIDVGIKEFATLSDGTVISNPKYLKQSMRKLKRTQRRLARKVKGSSNRNKYRQTVAILHEKVANQRKDFLHKASRGIANSYHTIAIEDLNIAGMVKNHSISGAINDAGWGMFYTMLQYKANQVIKVPRFAPTTKTCSKCGSVKPMKLSDRTYECVCGHIMDRDLNAAINILTLSTVKTTGINAYGEQDNSHSMK